MSEETVVSLDDLLEGTIEDLPELAGFETWPAGTYLASCSMEYKTVNENPCVEVSFKLIETKELAKPEEDRPPTVGSVNSELCTLNREIGLANLKRFLKVFGQHFGISKNREIIDAVKDVEVLVVNKPRWDKKNQVWRFRADEIAVVPF